MFISSGGMLLFGSHNPLPEQQDWQEGLNELQQAELVKRKSDPIQGQSPSQSQFVETFGAASSHQTEDPVRF